MHCVAGQIRLLAVKCTQLQQQHESRKKTVFKMNHSLYYDD